MDTLKKLPQKLLPNTNNKIKEEWQCAPKELPKRASKLKKNLKRTINSTKNAKTTPARASKGLKRTVRQTKNVKSTPEEVPKGLRTIKPESTVLVETNKTEASMQMVPLGVEPQRFYGSGVLPKSQSVQESQGVIYNENHEDKVPRKKKGGKKVGRILVGGGKRKSSKTNKKSRTTIFGQNRSKKAAKTPVDAKSADADKNGIKSEQPQNVTVKSENPEELVGNPENQSSGNSAGVVGPAEIDSAVLEFDLSDPATLRSLTKGHNFSNQDKKIELSDESLVKLTEGQSLDGGKTDQVGCCFNFLLKFMHFMILSQKIKLLFIIF